MAKQRKTTVADIVETGLRAAARMAEPAPVDTDRDFDGLIECDGEPMGYWLPPGVSLDADAGSGP